MPFTLIKGTFHVKGYSPDGDSIRFKAEQLSNWSKLKGPKVTPNALGHVQLRFEAIDTLETHYEGLHQPLKFAEAALKTLLTRLNIKHVLWDTAHSRIFEASDGTPGYILAREIDKYRRPIVFVFAGTTPLPDGSSQYISTTEIKKSVNYLQLQDGLAYPTYYSGLFPDLRSKFTSAVHSARGANQGLWSQDKTLIGFEVNNPESITEKAVILPKLFRRIASYMLGGGTIEGFKDYLRDDPDPVLYLKDGHFTNLDTFITVTNTTVKMEVDTEELIFLPKP